jgi:hypothetical protein
LKNAGDLFITLLVMLVCDRRATLLGLGIALYVEPSLLKNSGEQLLN